MYACLLHAKLKSSRVHLDYLANIVNFFHISFEAYRGSQGLGPAGQPGQAVLNRHGIS
jgi:hypothetical protein